MQEIELKIFFELLRAGILGEKPDGALFAGDLTNESVEEIRNLALRHDVVLTVYAALEGAEEPALRSLKQSMKRFYAPRFAKSVNQSMEAELLLQTLESEGIDCLALKGWQMRELYADPLSRSMTDLDILIRDYRYEQIGKALGPLGYHGKGHSSWKHDKFVKEPYMMVEMHRRLTDDSDAIRDWERGIWERAVLEEGCRHRYRMSEEDFYLFHLVHMHKDFLNGALGFRRLADLWLLRKKGEGTDWAQVSRLLESMGLGRFEERMARLAAVCFDGAEPDEDSKTLLGFAAGGAVFTDDQRYKLGRMVALSGKSARRAKLSSLISAVFLPYSRMKAQFPAVEKHPILLPWFWLKRIFKFLRHPAKRLQKLNYSGLDEARYEQMRQVFRAGGVLPEKSEGQRGDPE